MEMDDSRVLAMGAMETWGDVRIGVMSANDTAGAENARLRVMSPHGSRTVRVALGESVGLDGVGTVTLLGMSLHHGAAGDGPAPTGRGSLEVSFRAAADGAEQ